METASLEAVEVIGTLTDCICSGDVSRAFDDTTNASVAHTVALHLVRPLLPYLDPLPGAIDRNPELEQVSRQLMPLLGSCVDIWLPAIYCPSCCVAVQHPQRMLVSIVRNPFSRFVSGYKWLKGDPGRFAEFVEAFHQHWLTDRLSVTHPDTVAGERFHLDFDWGTGWGPGRSWLYTAELYHFRAGFLELRDGFSSIAPFKRNISTLESNEFLGLKVHLIHLESLGREWPSLLQTLCTRFSFCRPLPSILRLNAGRRQEVDFVWKPETATLIQEMFAQDFALFGYRDTPEDLSPIRPNMITLDL
mmetsp:Transcript_58966/g.129447  ORF Transcript_58966/g.129447 Transcript_58966/m.129447 type:complete len:304 (-) Transcript_58966:17-928(-)